jgi:hypothetical protein
MRTRLAVPLAALLTLVGGGVATAGGTATAGKVPATKGAATQSLGSYRIVTGPTYRIPPYGFQYSTATCPAGLVPLGGGESNSAGGTMLLTDSYPTGTNSWTVYVKNTANDIQSFTSYAICGS